MVGAAQWLAAPGDPRQNLSVALGMVENAAARGVELLVLPELWSCGYDPETLARDARRDAEPADGPRAAQLADAARCHELFLAAGSVPELGEDGRLHETALVFNPRGELVARHRKTHLFPPTLEHSVFTPGDHLTTFADPALALTNSQWWVQANQAGSHQTSTLLGASRIIAPTGTVVAQASAAMPGCASPAELLVHRIDLHIAHRREGAGALLEEERRPALYGDLVAPMTAPR